MKKMQIFIVEDDSIIVNMLSEYLSRLGHEIILASSAEKAIEILQKMENFVGVFLVDMQLAGKLNGVDFVVWLRDNGAYNPVVMMTGNSNTDLVKKCLDELSVDCFIDKPASLLLIKATLEKAVDSKMRGVRDGIFIKESSDGALRYLSPKRGVEFASLTLPNRRVSRIICISSQSGCKMGCKFCATGMQANKHVRNLSVEELLQQVYIPQDYCQDRRKNVCVSIMGMGEPSNNLENITEFIERLDERYSIAISTVGVISKLKKLVKKLKGNKRIELQFSLHFPWDELRAQYMPVARKNPLAKIIPLLEDFSRESPLPVCVNYTVFKGLNDGNKHVEALVKLIQGKRLEVKLTEVSPIGIYQSVAIQRIEEIEEILDAAEVPHRRFFSKGKDIGSGCGQMAAKIRVRG